MTETTTAECGPGDTSARFSALFYRDVGGHGSRDQGEMPGMEETSQKRFERLFPFRRRMMCHRRAADHCSVDLDAPRRCACASMSALEVHCPWASTPLLPKTVRKKTDRAPPNSAQGDFTTITRCFCIFVMKQGPPGVRARMRP